MKSPLWLFPFTSGGDMSAIDSVMCLAESAEATLVPVSLLSQPSDSQRQGARLEHLQQSKDFMEAVQYKAARSQVPLQHYEVITVDVLHSIKTLAHEMRCNGIVLVISGGKSQLLRDDELRHLLFNPPASLLLLRLPMPAETGAVPRLWARFLPRLSRHWKHQDIIRQEQKMRVTEKPISIEAEQHCQG